MNCDWISLAFRNRRRQIRAPPNPPPPNPEMRRRRRPKAKAPLKRHRQTHRRYRQFHLDAADAPDHRPLMPPPIPPESDCHRLGRWEAARHGCPQCHPRRNRDANMSAVCAARNLDRGEQHSVWPCRSRAGGAGDPATPANAANPAEIPHNAPGNTSHNAPEYPANPPIPPPMPRRTPAETAPANAKLGIAGDCTENNEGGSQAREAEKRSTTIRAAHNDSQSNNNDSRR